MATIYESMTNKYRIRKETRINGNVWYYPEKFSRWFIFGRWEGNAGYSDFDKAKSILDEMIEDDNYDYAKSTVAKNEIL